jgi:hypothetical protein
MEQNQQFRCNALQVNRKKKCLIYGQTWAEINVDLNLQRFSDQHML